MYYLFLILGLVFSQYCQHSCLSDNCKSIRHSYDNNNMICSKCSDKFSANDCCAKTLYPSEHLQTFSCPYKLQIQAEKMLYITANLVDNYCQHPVEFSLITDNNYNLGTQISNSSITFLVATGGHAYINIRYLVQECPVTIVTSYIMT